MERDDAMEVWLESNKKNLDNLASSTFFLGLITPNYLKDPQCMLCLGAAICLDKPICLMVMDNAEIPPKLFQIADKVIFTSLDELPNAQAEVREFLEFHMEKQG